MSIDNKVLVSLNIRPGKQLINVVLIKNKEHETLGELEMYGVRLASLLLKYTKDREAKIWYRTFTKLRVEEKLNAVLGTRISRGALKYTDSLTHLDRLFTYVRNKT